MSGMTLSALLNAKKKMYLERCKEHGGTAAGFRDHIKADFLADPDKYRARMLDAVMEATTKNWQAQPRKIGPDLFRINGMPIPEFLTRPVSYVTGDDIADDDENRFEKVDYQFATVADLNDDTTIKLRKAAQASASAEQQAKAYDEARRRAGGRMNTFLKNVADK